LEEVSPERIYGGCISLLKACHAYRFPLAEYADHKANLGDKVEGYTAEFSSFIIQGQPTIANPPTEVHVSADV
jgi:hypothetical protein